MTIKAVIFDLDGTLLDTITDITNSMNCALADFSLVGYSEEEYKYLVGSGLTRLVDGVLPAEMADNDTVEKFVEKFREYYKQKWREHSIPFNGINELLSSLQEKGVVLAVFSNKPHTSTVEMIEEFFPGIFEMICGERTEEGFPKKPDPTVALYIATALSVNPADVLFVGDSDVDMQVAVSSGMTAVGALWGFRTKEELLENGAHHLVSRPEDIIELVK